MDQRCLSVKPAPVVLKIWIGVVNVSFLSLISCYLFPSSFFPWFPLFNGSRHIHVNEQPPRHSTSEDGHPLIGHDGMTVTH